MKKKQKQKTKTKKNKKKKQKTKKVLADLFHHYDEADFAFDLNTVEPDNLMSVFPL